MSLAEESQVDSSCASASDPMIALEENGESLPRSVFTGGQIDPKRRLFQSVRGLFSNIFQDAKVLSVDPLRCLSIETLRSRSFCRWGVRRIKNVILGHSNADTFVKGFVSTGKFGVVSEIPRECSELVVEHFIRKGKSESQARSLEASGRWYHVVDGGHLHQALVEIILDYSENFAGFKWPVVAITWQSDEYLRAIGRMCNEMQKESHIVDFPLPDAMQSLRDIIDVHGKRTGVPLMQGQRLRPGFIKEVIEIYSGCPGYSCNTLRTVCGSVLKLSSSFVSSMRDLLTEECDEYWESLGARRPFGDDTRVYKKLISTHSLKRATLFLDQKAMTDDDRVRVIHRLRFVAKERESFKAFQSAEIEKQSRCVIAARKEIRKFEGFLDNEPWPSEMENLKRNMLETTLVDEIIKEHIGAQSELLPAMVAAYLKAKGAHGSQKLGQYHRRLEIEQEQEDVVIGTACCEANRGDHGRRKSGIENLGDSVDTDEQEVAFQSDVRYQGNINSTVPDDERQDLTEEDPDAALRQTGIEIHMKNLLEYEQNSADIGRSFDFIIADPYQKVPSTSGQNGGRTRASEDEVLDEIMDEKGISLYVQAVRRLLQPGGTFFVFLNWKNLEKWASCCENGNLEVICEPFLVMKDTKRIQKLTLNGLQNVYDPALVLRKPGRHGSGFEIDKVSPYVHLPACRMPRWCNVIDGVPPPAQRLTFKPSRAHVRPNERPCALIIEILTTFCPAKGKVLDPFAGALTTGLACAATNRNCVLLETDERCLFHAKLRLREFANAKINEAGMKAFEPANDRTSAVEELQHHENATRNEAATEENDSGLPIVESIVQRGCGVSDEEVSRTFKETASRREGPLSRASEEDTVPESLANERDSDGENVSVTERISVQRSGSSVGSITAERSNVYGGAGNVDNEREDFHVIDQIPKLIKRPHVSKRRTFISDNSPAVAPKRNRQLRSPLTRPIPGAEICSPGAFRRSKRTRRPVLRYEE